MRAFVSPVLPGVGGKQDYFVPANFTSQGRYCRYQTKIWFTRTPNRYQPLHRTTFRRPSGCTRRGGATPTAVTEVGKSVLELKERLKRCTLYFVGCMGSGKTVVGEYMANQLGYRFLDMDTIIEGVAGKPIREIFEKDGEEEFRRLETSVLDNVQAYVGCCVSTGGGVVTRRENWGKLQTGLVVWLDVPVDVLVKRLEGDSTRPLLVGRELTERLNEILDKRRRMYAQADVRVQVNAEMGVNDVVMETVRLLNNFIKSHPPRHSKLFPGKFPDVKQS